MAVATTPELATAVSSTVEAMPARMQPYHTAGPLLHGHADPNFLPMLADQVAALNGEMAAGDLIRQLATETAACPTKAA